jgi:GT2 family glycosyltransferase
MIGIVITARNRAELTLNLLECLKKSYFPAQGAMMIYVDDCSTETDSIDILDNLQNYFYEVYRERNAERLGVAKSLQRGLDTACDIFDCDILINLDNDTLVKPDWLFKLLDLHKRFPDAVVTGFNTLSCDLGTGNPRHPIIKEYDDYVKKKSIGGINMVFSKETYLNHIRPCLDMKGHWDWNVCQRGLDFYCTKPSVIQHTGIKEGMNMNNPDIAHDY